MKRLIGMAAALLLATTATSASARADDVSAADTADMQCFVLLAYLSGQAGEDSAEQSGLVGGMMYFLGRLEGREPGTDWMKGLADYILSVDDDALVVEMESNRERCGDILVDRGQALTDWGATVSAAAEARGD
ncbi:MAG: hypothetical protein ACOH1E_04250 [Brevundimonas sp.]